MGTDSNNTTQATAPVASTNIAEEISRAKAERKLPQRDSFGRFIPKELLQSNEKNTGVPNNFVTALNELTTATKKLDKTYINSFEILVKTSKELKETKINKDNYSSTLLKNIQLLRGDVLKINEKTLTAFNKALDKSEKLNKTLEVFDPKLKKRVEEDTDKDEKYWWKTGFRPADIIFNRSQEGQFIKSIFGAFNNKQGLQDNSTNKLTRDQDTDVDVETAAEALKTVSIQPVKVVEYGEEAKRQLCRLLSTCAAFKKPEEGKKDCINVCEPISKQNGLLQNLPKTVIGTALTTLMAPVALGTIATTVIAGLGLEAASKSDWFKKVTNWFKKPEEQKISTPTLKPEVGTPVTTVPFVTQKITTPTGTNLPAQVPIEVPLEAPVSTTRVTPEPALKSVSPVVTTEGTVAIAKQTPTVAVAEQPEYYNYLKESYRGGRQKPGWSVRIPEAQPPKMFAQNFGGGFKNFWDTGLGIDSMSFPQNGFSSGKSGGFSMAESPSTSRITGSAFSSSDMKFNGGGPRQRLSKNAEEVLNIFRNTPDLKPEVKAFFNNNEIINNKWFKNALDFIGNNPKFFNGLKTIVKIGGRVLIVAAIAYMVYEFVTAHMSIDTNLTQGLISPEQANGLHRAINNRFITSIGINLGATVAGTAIGGVPGGLIGGALGAGLDIMGDAALRQAAAKDVGLNLEEIPPQLWSIAGIEPDIKYSGETGFIPTMPGDMPVPVLNTKKQQEEKIKEVNKLKRQWFEKRNLPIPQEYLEQSTTSQISDSSTTNLINSNATAIPPNQNISTEPPKTTTGNQNNQNTNQILQNQERDAKGGTINTGLNSVSNVTNVTNVYSPESRDINYLWKQQQRDFNRRNELYYI